MAYQKQIKMGQVELRAAILEYNQKNLLPFTSDQTEFLSRLISQSDIVDAEVADETHPSHGESVPSSARDDAHEHWLEDYGEDEDHL